MRISLPPRLLLQTALAGGLIVLAACGTEQTASYNSSGASNVARERAATAKLAAEPALAPHAPQIKQERDNYADMAENPVHLASREPVSTFSIDVDTGSYTNARRFLNEGQLPPKEAVRVEEFINYFDYDYPLPEDRAAPFSVTTEVAPTPWNPDTRLLHIGIKAYDEPKDDRPPANLVFLVDVSGSMQSQDKLPLLQSSLKLLVNQMTGEDRIALVTYAGNTRLALGIDPRR